MEKTEKKYEGTVYLGAVGSGIEHAICRDSIQRIEMRQGDTGVHFIRATKGYEARQSHINIFLQGGHDFILLLDSDMTFEPDTLEKLRSHKKPYVSGLYMRRNWQKLGTVWYRPFTGSFPFEPWVGKVSDGLHEIGASGWGCILIHRDVILAVRELLKGEWEVLEDDMDIMPYDIRQIMRAINGLNKLCKKTEKIDTIEVKAYVDVLRAEIVPLRCDRGMVGSDIRFPFFAQLAGYQLLGDGSVRPGHVVDFPLDGNMYNLNFDDEQFEAAYQITHDEAEAERAQLRKQYRRVRNA